MARPVTPYVRRGPVLTGHFDVGVDYATHRPAGTPDWLLVLTCAGAGTFGDAGDRSAEGDACLLPPGTPHAFATDPASGRWELRWAHFTPPPDWLDLLDWPAWAGGVRRLALPGRALRDIIDRWTHVHHAALSAHSLRDRLALNAMEAMLLAADPYRPRRGQRRPDELVRQTVAFVTARLSEPLPVELLAEQAGLSVSRFAHRFRAATGQSPAAFVEACRVRRAAQLLTATALGTKQIAAQLGFSSPFYFSARFKKHTGHSPTAFRHSAISGPGGPASGD